MRLENTRIHYYIGYIIQTGKTTDQKQTITLAIGKKNADKKSSQKDQLPKTRMW